jgi:AcrR family transcriptional regulator
MPDQTPRDRLLEAAARLLTEHGEFSTRAVCEAAGVAAPTLYHHFGDRDGLIRAAIAHAYESNLARKRARKPSDDPVDDIRRGWDEHVEFAADHPAFYRLMYAYADASPEPPEPALEAREILMGEIRRVADAGRLRAAPELAAETIGAAVRGVGAMFAAERDVAIAETVNELIREAVLRTLFIDAGGSSADGAAEPHAAAVIELVRAGSDRFSSAEAGLLVEWLSRLLEGERKEIEG